MIYDRETYFPRRTSPKEGNGMIRSSPATAFMSTWRTCFFFESLAVRLRFIHVEISFADGLRRDLVSSGGRVVRCKLVAPVACIDD